AAVRVGIAVLVFAHAPLLYRGAASGERRTATGKHRAMETIRWAIRSGWKSAGSVPAAFFPNPAVRPFDPAAGDPGGMRPRRLAVFAGAPDVILRVWAPAPMPGDPHQLRPRRRWRHLGAERRRRVRRDDDGRHRAAGFRGLPGDCRRL